MVIDTSDLGISKELFLHRIHEPIATELLKASLRDGMSVVDIGANLGYYVLLEALKVGVRGRVIAVEPVPHNVEVLRRNITLNGIHNVTVIEGAIGDYDGPGRLFLSDHSNCHSMVPSHDTGKGTTQVDVHTLDSLVANLRLTRLDLVRMDIQGGEVAAMKGMTDAIERYRPMLTIELHPQLVGRSEIAGLLGALKDLDYESRYIVPRAMDVPPARRLAAREILSSQPSLNIDEMINDCLTLSPERWLTGFFEPTERLSL